MIGTLPPGPNEIRGNRYADCCRTSVRTRRRFRHLRLGIVSPGRFGRRELPPYVLCASEIALRRRGLRYRLQADRPDKRYLGWRQDRHDGAWPTLLRCRCGEGSALAGTLPPQAIPHAGIAIFTQPT